MKKILLLLTLIIIYITSFQYVYAETISDKTLMEFKNNNQEAKLKLGDNLKTFKENIVHIKNYKISNNGKKVLYSKGTGFFLPNGYILTAFHVIDNGDYIEIETIGQKDTTHYKNGLKITISNNIDINPKVVYKNKHNDFAIINSKWDNHSYFNYSFLVNKDEELFTIGHPIIQDNKGNTIYYLWNTSSGIVQEKSIIVPNPLEKEYSMQVITSKMNVFGGNSGGPLFNKYGEVVGLVFGKTNEIAFSTTIESIIKNLKEESNLYYKIYSNVTE